MTHPTSTDPSHLPDGTSYSESDGDGDVDVAAGHDAPELDDSTQRDVGRLDAELAGVAPTTDASAGVPVESPFSMLPPELSRTLGDRGFSSLTPVQHGVATADTLARDLRLSSQTGSGKTVAVGIAIGRQLIAGGRRAQSERTPTVLLLAPTRELAGQVQRELDWLVRFIPDASTEVVTGGTSVGLDRKHLDRGPRVLVGTPGRVLDHLKSGALDGSRIGMVVLDEADQMLDLGFRDDLEEILGQLPARARTHLVSATFSGEVLRIANGYQSEPLVIQGSPLGSANSDIEHVAHVVPPRLRYDALVNVLLAHQAALAPDDPVRILVFTRTRMDTGEVAEALQRDGFRAEPLSGELAQAARERTLGAFRRGRIAVLVATDVAARGLDVDGITLVVHFDPPGDPEALTHRSGRTGRAGQKGTSVLLMPPQARRRVERLLEQARIRPSFAPVPTAQKIEKLYQKRSRRRLFDALAAEPAADHLEYAKKVLEEQPPDRVIATLLSMIDEKPPCRPHDIAQPQFSEHPERRGGHGDRNSGDRGAPRSYGDRGPSGPRPKFERPRSGYSEGHTPRQFADRQRASGPGFDARGGARFGGNPGPGAPRGDGPQRRDGDRGAPPPPFDRPFERRPRTAPGYGAERFGGARARDAGSTGGDRRDFGGPRGDAGVAPPKNRFGRKR